MTHTLPPLPFPQDALEPWMSAETLEYHYGKHHKGYVDKLNQLIQGTEHQNSTLEQIIKSAKPGPVFNNAAQVWNHTFFWNSLSGDKPSSKPQIGQKLKSFIDRDFGTVARFEEEFKKAALARFGSGWAWLVLSPTDGKLTIETTSNADTPLAGDRKPLLTCDLWEHAYYIDYRNERAEFVDAFFQIVNWEFAERNLVASQQVGKTAAA